MSFDEILYYLFIIIKVYNKLKYVYFKNNVIIDC